MRLVRAGLYLPIGLRDGRRVVAPDEDRFTLVATALERAVGGLALPAGPIRVEWLGEDGPDIDEAVPRVLGAPAEVVRSPGSSSALREACERARHEGERTSILVGHAILGPLPEPPRSSSDAPAHDGAFAFVFGPQGSLEVSELLEAIPEDAAPLPAAIGLHHALAERAPGAVWVGDWEEGSLPTRPAGPDPGSLPDRLRSVSEGAYVPRPRYLETLPSRWRFVAEECEACRAITFPVRRRCRVCGRTEGLGARELPREGGAVVAATTIGRGGQPTEFDPVVETFGPYQVVLVELAPGARVPLQVTDAAPGEVRIGDRVNTLLRRLYAMEGEWRYGRKAVPVRTPATRT